MTISKFQIALISILILLFIFMVFQDKPLSREVIEDENTVVVFSQPGCSACEKQKDYINNVLKEKYSEITFESHNVTEQKEYELLQVYFEEYGVNPEQAVLPVTFYGDNYVMGFKDGRQLENLLQNRDPPEAGENPPKYIDTWFGRIDVLETSLPALAVIMGLLDGFNPCAMWVLVYMISLIAGMDDKRRIWLIVGTFVFASAVLYYLFMTALLNVFLYIGYLRILQLIIGFFAIYVGIIHLKDRNKTICEVSDLELQQKTRGKIRGLVESKISVLTVLGIIGLAFAVNSMEFVCSAALPAVFTGALAQAELSGLQYYGYILLYVFFFMLNQLIIFSAAAFTVNYYVSDRFLVPMRTIGGVIILGLGVVMVFFPEMLM